MSILAIQGFKHCLLAGAIILGVGAPALAQGTENLSIGTVEGNDGGGSNGTAIGLTDAMIEPGPGELECPDDPQTRYDLCFGARPMTDGSFYQGRFTNDVPEGFGREQEADGTTYVGEFSQGRRHGTGTLYDRDGAELYGGAWENGLPDDPDGTFLQKKQRKNLIKALQAELNRNGCSAGSVDGIVGPRTRNAARSATESKPELLLDGDPFSSTDRLYRLWQSLRRSAAQTCAA